MSRRRRIKKSASAKTQNFRTEDFLPRTEIAADKAVRGSAGIIQRRSADSVSVDVLNEEGNAFEADVVAGMQNVGDTDEKEVRMHEVPEDDVPGEYLDKD